MGLGGVAAMITMVIKVVVQEERYGWYVSFYE